MGGLGTGVGSQGRAGPGQAWGQRWGLAEGHAQGGGWGGRAGMCMGTQRDDRRFSQALPTSARHPRASNAKASFWFLPEAPVP